MLATHERDLLVIARWNRGDSVADIADSVRTTTGNVYQIVRRARLGGTHVIARRGGGAAKRLRDADATRLRVIGEQLHDLLDAGRYDRHATLCPEYAARLLTVQPMVIYRALWSGALLADKEDGRWYIELGDLADFAWSR